MRIHLQNEGAGIPDGGLFTEDQLRRKTAVELSQGVKPSRGVIEAKSAAGNVNAIANSRQVARYWQSYRQVLVTTYRTGTSKSRCFGNFSAKWPNLDISKNRA